ncbi:transposase [Variovorax sp. J22R133]|uniref:transposase n=1 Tax=Variovorax brevis TaxID=3053503 RepID=UPI002578E522|nr:transposase [Variovorax sp. J22R133]MDM0117999.1 transposase [Variovorax sp. J22R133]
MKKRPRRNHSPVFKAKVAIEALADGKTIDEMTLKHDVHPNQVTEWRRQLIERAALAGLEELKESNRSQSTQLRPMRVKRPEPALTADDGSPLHSFRTLLQDLSTLGYKLPGGLQDLRRGALMPVAVADHELHAARPTAIQAA